MTDVLIVGGGLIGMLTAIELHQAGASVQILERSRMGGESSWAGGGILSPLYPWRYADAVNVLAKYGHEVYPQIARQLHQDGGMDPEYIRSGLMVLDQHEHEQAEAWARQWQMGLQTLPEPVEIEPRLSTKYHNALWMPEIGQMRNPRLMKSLQATLDAYGIAYKEYTRVEALQIKQGKMNGVVAEGESYVADKVLIAGGPWSRKIIEDYGEAPQVEPVKGQMVVFKAQPDLLKHIVLSGGRYLIPRKDGRIVVGSTLEYTDFNKTVNDGARDDLTHAAIEILPSLETFAVEKQWAGLRPGSPNGIPYICSHPDIEGLYISTGHFRNGVILGAASARLMADMMQGKPSVIDAQAYRFDAMH